MRWQPATLLILPVSASLLPVPPSGAILVVGASGGTGMLALQGMLDTGCAPSRLCVLSRNPSKPSLQPLVAQGVQVRWGDLDDPATLPAAVEGCSGCYVHSTTADTKKLDAGEVVRAQHLAAALKAAGVGQVVYNSFAAEPGHGVKRIEQKHAVEAVFSEEYGLVIVQPPSPRMSRTCLTHGGSHVRSRRPTCALTSSWTSCGRSTRDPQSSRVPSRSRYRPSAWCTSPRCATWAGSLLRASPRLRPLSVARSTLRARCSLRDR